MAPLFEGAPGFLYRLAAARPFGSPETLFERARVIAHAMPEPLQVELVDAHPRLGAPPASVSAMSFREQGYDVEAAENLAAEAARERAQVAAELDRLNREYEGSVRVPILCLRGRPSPIRPAARARRPRSTGA